MENNTNQYQERRKTFMETYAGDMILSTKIPEIAAELIKGQFGINIYEHSLVPIVFTVGWTEILKRLGSESTDECKLDVCGAQIEYMTEISESDKSTNIVPQMRHVREPIFQKNESNSSIGASFMDELTSACNTWRSVYAMETLTGIENKVREIVLTDYNIDLYTPAIVYPILGAVYAAGIELARQSKATINMYNIFEVDVIDDNIILTPLAFVKQWLKNDSKK